MRLSIRWKLILSIGVPLILICGAFGWRQFGKLRTWAQAQARDQAQREVDAYVARLNGDFSQIAQVARSTAAVMTAHNDLTEKEIYALLEENIRQHSLIYGSCVAFAPNSSAAQRQLVAPYVHRSGESTQQMDIGRDSYDYTSMEWYAKPRTLNRGYWTEPYFDEGAGNVLMCTFSLPFYRNGAFWGTATVDVELDPLRNLIQTEELDGGFWLLMSQTGRFIYHRSPELIMKSSIQDRLRELGEERFLGHAEAMLRGEPGFLKMPNLFEGGQAWCFYAPLASTHWSLALAIPENAKMQPVYDFLRTGLLSLAVVILILLVVVGAVSLRFTGPIQRMALAVRELGQGKLDTQVSGVPNRDELGELAQGFNHMLGKLREHVQALAAETAAREAIESEIRVARDIQTSLIPRTFPAFPHNEEFDLYALLEPAKECAGDFYDFFRTDEKHIMFILADVSGKGVPAALFMAVTRTLLHNFGEQGLSPAALLNQVNSIVVKENENMMFVTLFVGKYETETGILTYTNAGHPSPYKRSADGGISTWGASTGTCLGMIEGSTWDEVTTQVEVGDTLLLYTDGVTEAGTSHQHMFEEAGLEQAFAAAGDKGPKELSQHILAAVHDFEGEVRSDDITVLALQRKK